MSPEQTDSNELMARAREALSHAYAPYSGFRVGAALAAASGRVYTGSNVENASYGITICAERVALFKAVSEGERAFSAIAIAAGDDVDAPPCGACRQALAEFSPELQVDYLVSGRVVSKPLSQLLPDRFSGGGGGS